MAFHVLQQVADDTRDDVPGRAHPHVIEVRVDDEPTVSAGQQQRSEHLQIGAEPRRFDDPNMFRLDRPRAKEHIGFGRGAHTCPGAPLARTETRVSLTRLLARMGDIRVSDEHHGPRDARTFNHEPTYILRGLVQLRLEFTPLEG